MPTFPEREKELLQQWEEKNIFKKSLEKASPNGSFVFFEGPPTANGKPGIHHAEARSFKDCIPRFKTMQGYHVIRKGGWDTHGLPVELEVEKQLGFTSKNEIEAYGIKAFNAKCRESVWKYLENWRNFTKRIGFWVDIDHPYVTYDPAYVESLWWIIKQVWDKGLLYKDYRVTPHCPRCETSLSSHELSQGYKDVKELSLTAKFKVVEPAQETPTYLLAWTTTPWTLPGNVGLAVGENMTYAFVEKEGEQFVLAKELVAKWFGGTEHRIVKEVRGTELLGWQYEPLFPFLREITNEENKQKMQNNAWRVYGADFVTITEGTGIVHTAVMYGADDFTLGNKVGLPKQHTVDLSGHFVPGTGFLAGRFVKEEGLDVEIIKDLAHRGLLFAKEKYEHSYPHCWRCKTPVIYYAKDSWYIRMSDLREKMLAENERIHWEPSHIKDGRFGEWLREVKDWAFSRERYWGTPLPIWECQKCDKRECIGSFEELFAHANKLALNDSKGIYSRENFDPHRPFVDEIVLPCDCGGEMKRVADVCDVWFDSGSMPFAQWHYPFENKELVESGKAFPADYISEAIDQTRGWFYTLLAVSSLLGKERPYKNVICLGHVLDAQGKKMSKSIGNVVEPMEMMEKYGADAVRWYMYTINQPGESKRFDEKALADMVRKNFTILQNVAAFYLSYASDGVQAVAPTHVLDRWILSRLHMLVRDNTALLEEFKITEPVRELGEFIQDLSTWYVRRSRDRFKGEDAADKASALVTLRECLLTLSKLMAPFAPFLAEDLYGHMKGEEESVHLAAWPQAQAHLIDESVLTQMRETRTLVTLALEQRAQAGINIRQPLASVLVTLPSGELSEAYVAVLQDEVNVKQVRVATGERKAELDLQLSPELVREGLSREIIRRLNAMRKDAGLTIADRIEVFVSGTQEEVKQTLEEHREAILYGTLADALHLNSQVDSGEEFSVRDVSMKLSLRKIA